MDFVKEEEETDRWWIDKHFSGWKRRKLDGLIFQVDEYMGIEEKDDRLNDGIAEHSR